MGIRVDGDHIIAFLKHISFVPEVIIGHQIFHREGNLNGLRGTRLQQ